MNFIISGADVQEPTVLVVNLRNEQFSVGRHCFLNILCFHNLSPNLHFSVAMLLRWTRLNCLQKYINQNIYYILNGRLALFTIQ